MAKGFVTVGSKGGGGGGELKTPGPEGETVGLVKGYPARRGVEGGRLQGQR